MLAAIWMLKTGMTRAINSAESICITQQQHSSTMSFMTEPASLPPTINIEMTIAAHWYAQKAVRAISSALEQRSITA